MNGSDQYCTRCGGDGIQGSPLPDVPTEPCPACHGTGRSSSLPSPTWEGLTPPYGTIVVDPPWRVRQPAPGWGKDRDTINAPLPYTTMSLAEIKALPIPDLAADYAHLYLWTVNRHVGPAFDIVKAWGFSRPTVLVWCKQPRGLGPGREYASTTEFVLFARRGTSQERVTRQDSSWWLWPRRAHSEKPQEFYDMVPTVSPGPYVEVFARGGRHGWDGWGDEYAPPEPDLFSTSSQPETASNAPGSGVAGLHYPLSETASNEVA